MSTHLLERFYACTMELDEYEVPAYMYGDWAVHADLNDDTGWCILPLVGTVRLPYVFDTALEAAQWVGMLNGIAVEWDNLGSGDLIRIAEVLTPLYLARYREYTYVNAA